MALGVGRAMARWAVLIVGVGLALPAAAGAASFSYTQTLPVPPASTYQGSGGGDGWAVALTPAAAFNVFHHSSSLVVACHLQSDASSCWSPRTVVDEEGKGFRVSGQPGLWVDQASHQLFVFATRDDDESAGVVCIDARVSASEAYCGYVPLTDPGDAPASSGVSNPVLVGSRWYAFNYSSEVEPEGGQNALLCFDTFAKDPCPDEPFAGVLPDAPVGLVSQPAFWVPSLGVAGTRVIVPFPTGNGTDKVTCFDGVRQQRCAGNWPVTLAGAAATGAPIPLLTSTGTVAGFCARLSGSPCFGFDGVSVASPPSLDAAIGRGTVWNGPPVTIGPRVFAPVGSDDVVACYDFSQQSNCLGYPRPTPGAGYLYTVNADPQRPTCLWLNADSGGAQIQNFDAFSGGTCGEGPVRVLASSIVVPTDECKPSAYSTLTVVKPDRASYDAATVTFLDGSGQPIVGAPPRQLASDGSVSLAGLGLETSPTLPQFLIALDGTGIRPGEVTVRLTWEGDGEEDCVRPGATVVRPDPPSPPSPPAPVEPGEIVIDDVPTASAAGNTWVSYSSLAASYKPVWEVAREDEGFWPIDFETVFKLRNDDKRRVRGGKSILRFDPPTTCARTRDQSRRPGECKPVTARSLKAGAGRGQFLDYPEDIGTDGYRKLFSAALRGRGPTQGTTVFYPYIGGRANVHGGKLTLQYWVFFGYNHLGGLGVGHHEGDWEHISIVFSGERDDANRRIRNPRPLGVFFVSHGGLGKPFGWNSRDVRRIADGGDCDESGVVRKRGRWICTYSARASHASYNHSGKMPRDNVPDDHLTSSFSKRWHLHRAARLDGLIGHPWACWAGKAGQPTDRVQSGKDINPPWMPLMQQEGNEGGDPCGLTRAQASQSSPGGQASELDLASRCENWSPNIYADGTTRVVVCDQARLSAWMESAEPEREEVLTTRSSLDGDDSGPSVVATREVPQAHLGALRIDANAPVLARVQVDTPTGAGRVERVLFTDVALSADAGLRLKRNSDGTVTLLGSDGSALASAAPVAVQLRPLRIGRRAWAARRLAVKRLSGSRFRISWDVQVPRQGTRFDVIAQLNSGRQLRLARVRGSKRAYAIVRSISPDTRSILVVSTRGARAVRTQAHRVRSG